MLRFLYRLVKPLLFRLDAETAHRMVLAMLSAWPISDPPAAAQELNTRVFGLEFNNPVGLAAGLDKDAAAPAAWQALGFGFAELGTITPRPQAGTSRPRIWRLPEQRALINQLGFPSKGMEAVGRRIEELRAKGLRLRIGLNIGPNKATPASRVASDYAMLARGLGALADFIVINLSSPNTPGLRAFQSPERLREIRAAIDEPHPSTVRYLVKLSPDIGAAELGAICDTIVQLGFAGIVATNTTLARTEVGIAWEQAGGLSGLPLRERSRDMVRAIRRHIGTQIPIIGVGGIASAEDAYRHIRAGASLVELYTGLIFEGPTLATLINAGLAALLRRDGFRSISDAVGVDA
ncbi:MAG: quinone-dependent dihydroorotate dehydrogenase [Deltaproteobacteria bacterium]|nr:quinone-dependent dihydroorotate dehydrogenase [Deltaproteobacteria bacterium]